MANGTPWSAEELSILREVYGKTFGGSKNITSLPGRSVDAINIKANRIGIITDRSMSARKYTHDEHFFSEPTNRSSYWAGFIGADGNIDQKNKTMRIMLSHSDREHLCRFKNDIGYTGPIRTTTKLSTGNVYRTYDSIAITSSTTARDLRGTYNITPRKSLTLVPPEPWISRECALSYLAGYIDGDGCIRNALGKGRYVHPTINLVATLPVCDWARKLIGDVVGREIRPAWKTANGITHTIFFSGHSVVKFYETIKTLGLPLMERKWGSIHEIAKPSICIPWTEEEIVTMWKMFPYVSNKDMMEFLPQRTLTKVKVMGQRLGLRKAY